MLFRSLSIHREKQQKNKEFIQVNCMALNCSERDEVFDTLLSLIDNKKSKIIFFNDIDHLDLSLSLIHILAHEHNLSLAVQLGLFAGMRISEIAALQWKDIDLKNGFIQVRRNVQRVKNHEAGQRKTINQIGTPKSPKAFRSIPITSILMKSLKGYEKSTAKPEAFVIAKKGGSAYDVRTIQRYFKKIISVLKLDNYRFHDLRHTFATRAKESCCLLYTSRCV